MTGKDINLIKSATMAQEELFRNINGAAIMAAVALERGMTWRSYLAGSGLTRADIENPRTLVTFRQEFRMIRNLQAHCRNVPGLGLEVGSRYRFTHLASVGFLLVSSATLRSAFDVFLRYVDLNASMVRPISHDQGSDMGIGFIRRQLPEDIEQFAIERSSAVAMSLLEELLGRVVVPRVVQFSFARPRRFGQYRRYLRVAPVFGVARDLIVVKRTDADATLIRANPLALRVAEDYCSQLLASWKARKGLAKLVRDRIAARPGFLPDIDEIAKGFFMSSRTLRRRLAHEGTTFLELRDEVREALAEQLLSVPGLRVEQIAERLGFSEAASFNHAFRRWKGRTPFQFRTNLAR